MRRVIVLLLILLSIGLPSLPVAAQEETCLTFDSGGHPYTIVEGTTVAGRTGNGLTSIYSETPPTSGMEARVSIPVDSKPVSVSWWAYMGETNPYFAQIHLYSGVTELIFYNVGGAPYGPGDITGAYLTWTQHSFTLPVEDVGVVDRIEVRFWSAWADMPTADARYIIVDDIALGSDCTEPEEGYVRPLVVSDVGDWGIDRSSSTSRPETIFAFSNYVGAYVRAAADGFIESVRPLTQGDCQELLADMLISCVIWHDDGRYYIDTGLPFNASTSATIIPGYYRVILDSPALDKKFHYVISNPLTQAGDTVYAGCYIGKTGTFSGSTISLSVSPGSVGASTSGDSNARGFSAVAVKEDGTIIDSLDDFTIEPPAAAPCNTPEEYKACIGDGGLAAESSWSVSGGTFNDPGYSLPPGAQMTSNPPLYLGDNGASGLPRVRVNARSIGGEGSISIKLGTSASINSSVGADWSDIEYPADAHEPDAGSLYTVLIANGGDSTIQVRYICVAFTETPDGSGGGESPPEDEADKPPPCIFLQSSFNNGTGGWSVSGAVQSGAGEILVPSGQTFSQPISLHPDGDDPQDYTLTVRSALWHYNTYVPDPSNTDDVEFGYDFPADSSFTTIATKTYGDYADSDIVTHEVTFSISSSTTGTFTLSPTLSSTPTGVRGIAVRDVCLSAGDEFDPDETPPPPPGKQYPPDQPPTDGGGPFKENCNAISRPSGSDVGQWTAWHWGNLNRFFQCDLMILLNQMYKQMTESYRLFGWGTRWAQATVMRGVNFLWSFVQWLNGHLSNIALGQTTTIVSSAETCGNVFCLIQSLLDGAFDYLNNIISIIQQLIDYLLDPDSPFWEILKNVVSEAFGLVRDVLEFFMNIINSILSFVLTLAEAIIALILMIVGQVLNLGSLARDLIVSLMTAWNNATPTQIPGLPDCNTYSHFWCKGVWVLDNTVYAKSAMFTVAGPMEIIQTIMIGMGSISLLLWAVKTFKKAISDIGEGV